MRGFLVVVTFLFAVSSSPCKAEMTLETYMKLMTGSASERAVAETYIDGLGDGFTWANTELEANKMPLLFCYRGATSKQLFNKHAAEAVSKYFAKKGPTMKVPLSIMLLYRLKEAYPCQSSSK
jgi:hypothetical protein